MAYSNEYKANALIRLAANKNDFKKTSREMDVSERTLRRWARGKHISRTPQKKAKPSQNVKSDKKSGKTDKVDKTGEADPPRDMTVADYLEEAVKQMLGNVPSMSGDSWGVAIGILMDKWLILQDMPNQRTEELVRYLENLPPDDKSSIIEEAERVLAEHRSRRSDHRGSQPD